MKKLLGIYLLYLMTLVNPTWAGMVVGSGIVSGGGGSTCGAAGSGQGYGNITGFSANDVGAAYKMFAVAFTASATCTANTIRMYGRYVSGAASVKMAVLDNTLSSLATTSAVSLGSSDGWVSGSLSSTVSFTSGSTYYLAWIANADMWYYYKDGSYTSGWGSCVQDDYDSWYSCAPANALTWALGIEAFNQ